MNLTKLFNFKFMKQILKKAKGQLLIFLCIVPIFTFLSLLVTYSGEIGGTLDYENVSIINLLGLYVIPVILSINLFNYIYKRPSVDFINSMPINKKTIFWSNTLLGILLIIVMQLVNVLGILLFSILKPDIIVFSQMIWDIFIIATVSYIFVFTAANLAMCVSGNIITQIAVTCLIVFFMPFFINCFTDNFFDVRTGEYYIDIEGVSINGNEAIGLIEFDKYSETMPYRIIKCLFNSGVSLYNCVSIIKMILLSVIYGILGGILFKKRRFENLGESFNNVKIHEFVKALTMFPMFSLLNKMEILDSDIEVILLVYAVLIAYFVIFDIITSKKVNFKTTIISIIIVFVTLNLVTLGIEKIIDESEAKRYVLEDVESISIDISGYRNYYSDILDYEITDRNIINNVLKNNYSFVSTIKVRLNDGNELFVDHIFREENVDTSKEYLVNMLCADENYKNKIIESKLLDGYYTLYNEVKLKGDFKETVKNYIEEYQKNNINEEEKVYSIFDITKYYYKDHQIQQERYTIEDLEMKNKIVEIYNNDTKELIKNIEDDEYVYFDIRNESIDRSINGNLAMYKSLQSDNIKKLILNENVLPDLNKPYVIIRMYYKYISEFYYITNNEELINAYYQEINRRYWEDEYYYKDMDVEALEYLNSNTNTTNIVTNTTNIVTNTNEIPVVNKIN